MQNVEKIKLNKTNEKNKKANGCVNNASNILYFNISTEIEGRETTINCENMLKQKQNKNPKEKLCNYIIKNEMKFAK